MLGLRGGFESGRGVPGSFIGGLVECDCSYQRVGIQERFLLVSIFGVPISRMKILPPMTVPGIKEIPFFEFIDLKIKSTCMID